MTSHRYRALLIIFALLPAAAFAHPATEGAGFMHGLAHPLGGVDHLLAMFAVGVLASRFEGSQRWLLPAAFLVAMGVGGWIGASPLQLPFVELLIAMSLVAFGISIVATHAPRFTFAASIIATFAFFHGHAHGNEMVGSSMALYSGGFLLSTALIHAFGLWVALRVSQFGRRARDVVRMAGGGIALAGFALLGVLAV